MSSFKCQNDILKFEPSPNVVLNQNVFVTFELC